MPLHRDQYSRSPEALLASLSRNGDREAFAELVRRRQNWIRGLMRRCCGEVTLADDLAQQVFMQAWHNMPRLQQPRRFGAWLKRVAINVWLQHLRKHDPLKNADEPTEIDSVHQGATGEAIDLDRALAMLSEHVRLCIVLSYNEGMTHAEIAELTGMPLGTIKSHVRRGTKRLQEFLSAYTESPTVEQQV